MALFKTEIDFMGKRRIAVIFSAILLVTSVFAIGLRGLNLGIDFTGGLLLEVGYTQEANLPNIRTTIEGAGFDGALVQNFGTTRDVMIRLLPQEDVDSGQVGEQILEALRIAGDEVELRRVEFVGPQVGGELTERGGLAMLFAVIMILFYVMFRFQWKFAVGSVAALVHDVLITVGIFAMLQLPFDLAVLAAILAVIGYSLNDTIVVFDRIRENFRRIRKGTAESIMNKSINQMLGRTVITSATTMLVVLALLILGGEALSGFALALLIGVLVGTYSSIYTASTTALALDVSPADLIPPKRDEELDALP
jgi:preprotein translocase subunit SecF